MFLAHEFPPPCGNVAESSRSDACAKPPADSVSSVDCVICMRRLSAIGAVDAVQSG
jgi:hypothetical protein